MRFPWLTSWSTAVVLCASSTAAQDAHFLLPIPALEQRIARDSFIIVDIRGSRARDDRTSRAAVQFTDSLVFAIKFAPAPAGGHAFNNAPRFEVAAYELQKLFLDPPDYVVPPTLLRVFDLEWYRRLRPDVPPTFDNTASVVAVLQYWMIGVGQENVFDSKRFEQDTLYARRFGNLNIFTYLIRHNDANAGNVLIATSSADPRLFSVDNGVAFNNEESDRGVVWRTLRVNRLPASTIERLRRISRADLDRTLEVLAEYEIKDRRLVPAEKTEPINRSSGVRVRNGRVQFGLTRAEINGIENRLQQLLKRVDSGSIKTF